MDTSDIDVEVPSEGDRLNDGADIEVLGVPAKPIEDKDDIREKCGKDSKRCWLVCFAAFLSQVLIIGVLHVFGVFFVALTDEFNCSRAEAAWIGSIAYGLTLFLGPIISAFINRVGNRIVGAVGSVFCCVSLIVTSFMTDIPSMYGSFGVLYGIGTCCAYTPTMTIAGEFFDKYLTIATGIMVAGSSTGTLILSPITQTMLTAIGWRNSMRVLAGMVLIGVWSAYMFKPLSSCQGRSSSPNKAIKKSIAKPLMKELQLWKNKVFILWITAITFAMFGYYVPYVHLISHATDLGISPEKGSILLMLLGGSTATGRIMFGKIVDFGILNRLHMHQLSMVITGTACMLLPLIPTFPGLVVYVVMVGLVDGCFVVLMPVLTASLFGSENTVTAWGFLIGVSSIPFTLGPPVAGWLYDYYGSYDIAFHVAGVPIILGAITLMFIPWAQRTAVTTNVMTAARSIYDTTLYQETYDTDTKEVDDVPPNLYAITSEASNKSDEPMLRSANSETQEFEKPYLVVDITDAVRQKVEEAMASYRNKSAEVEEITDGPLSQLGTPAFRIGSYQVGGRSYRGTPGPQEPMAIKLAMSPVVMDNNSMMSSVPRIIYPGMSHKGHSGNTPSSSIATSFQGRDRQAPSASMAASGQSPIQDLRRRMMHIGHGGPSPSSIPRVVVANHARTSDINLHPSTSHSKRKRYLSDSETQTELKGISGTGIDPSVSSDANPFGGLTGVFRQHVDESETPDVAASKASPLKSPASQPFTTYEKQEQARKKKTSQEDSFVHVDLPNTSSQQPRSHVSSSSDVTPAQTPRKLGETEPMFQMSDISLSENKEYQQHPHPPKK